MAFYEIRVHKAAPACIHNIPHLPDSYDAIKRRFDTIAIGNQIFYYIAKIG